MSFNGMYLKLTHLSIAVNKLAEHCWNGDHTRPNATSRLRYNQMFIAKAVERMDKTAPPGADLSSWRY